MDRVSGCTGKLPYFTQGEARGVVKWFKPAGKNLEVYHCHYLLEGQEHWHITSMPNKLAKDIKKKMKRKYNL